MPAFDVAAMLMLSDAQHPAPEPPFGAVASWGQIVHSFSHI
jgi:hypothetical protein